MCRYILFTLFTVLSWIGHLNTSNTLFVNIIVYIFKILLVISITAEHRLTKYDGGKGKRTENSYFIFELKTRVLEQTAIRTENVYLILGLTICLTKKSFFRTENVYFIFGMKACRTENVYPVTVTELHWNSDWPRLSLRIHNLHLWFPLQISLPTERGRCDLNHEMLAIKL